MTKKIIILVFLGNCTFVNSSLAQTGWIPINSPVKGFSGRIDFITADDGYIGDSALYHTKNGGITWEKIDGLPTTDGQVDAFHFSTTTTGVMYSGLSKTIFFTTN